MTTLRKALFRMLCRTTVFESVYITQRLTSKKWIDNKAKNFASINQLEEKCP